MKCPYCPARIAYHGEDHDCPRSDLADPPHPDGFGGTDEGSHLMSSKQGMKEPTDEGSHLMSSRQGMKEPTKEQVNMATHMLKSLPTLARDLMDLSNAFVSATPTRVGGSAGDYWEIRRLQQKVDDLEKERNELLAKIDEGRGKERAAIVADVLGQAELHTKPTAVALLALADRWERGEHTEGE